MTHDQIVARIGEIDEELRSIAALDEVTDEQEARFDELTTEFDTLNTERQRIRAREDKAAEVRQALADGTATRESGAFVAPQVNAGRAKENPYDIDGVSTFGRNSGEVRSEMRSRALSAVESHRDLTDDQKQAVTSKLERGIKDPGGFVPAYILRTGSDDYTSAIGKYMAGAENLWTPEERSAVSRAQEVRAAMSLTDANGGYAIPFTLDNTLILTNNGTANPVRQIARQVTITTDSWNGLTSAGVTASWDGEIAEVSDDSPTFAQPSITPEKAQAFVQGSIEISEDYPGLVADLQMLFADAKDRLEGTAFINGTGANQPQGIITALDGGSSEVTPGTAETFAVGDIYKTLSALPPRFRNARTAWVANLGTINAMRQFATANNYHAFLTDMTAGSPSQLLGYSLYESSDMDNSDDINAAATGDNHILLVGDWSHYLIVDRVGGVVEYIPHLFNTSNNLPDGRRGWYYRFRTGADSLVDGAFRVLNVATTA